MADTPSRSLVAQALDRLMDIIVATQPGLPIPAQDQLARDFGMSRTVLREALSKLEYLNVITVRPKTGSKVNAPAQWQVINSDVLRWRLRAGETNSGLADRARLDLAAPRMFALLQELVDIEGPQPGNADWGHKVFAVIADVTGA